VLAPLGIMLSLQFETDDGKNVADAIADLDPMAVAGTFPLTGLALAAADAAGIPQFHVGSSHLSGVGTLNQTVGELQVDHLVSLRHRRLGFVFSDVGNLHRLGEFWLGGLREAALERGLPDVAVATVATDGTDAVDVARRLVGEGVTAVCAQSDPTAFVILHGVRRAGMRCPEDLAVMGVDANPTGHVTDPPLTTIEFDAETIFDSAAAGFMTALGYPPHQPSMERPVARLLQRSST
jgi:DNA-binding LacI/PurR family transcriptional regulator